MDNKKVYGVIATFAVIMAGLGTYVLTQEQIDNGYVCTVNENFGVFDHLSSTNKTGYWYNENNTIQSAVCRSGYWQKATLYMQEHNLSLNDLYPLNPDYINAPETFNWTTQNSCVNRTTSEIISTLVNVTYNSSYIDNVTHDNVSYSTIKQGYSYSTQEHTQQYCVENSLTIDSNSLSYNTDSHVSKRQGDVVCVWSKINGGNNIDSRSPEWSMRIKPGEDGMCSNVSVDDSIMRFKAKGVLQ